MSLIFLTVFVIGVAGCALFAIKQLRDRRSDPYVTLSDRRVRLKALRKKD